MTTFEKDVERLKMKSIPLCIHYFKKYVKKKKTTHTGRLKKLFFMRISLHIDIINTWFKDIENLGGLVLFLVFLCKMRYVTDYLQIVP